MQATNVLTRPQLVVRVAAFLIGGFFGCGGTVAVGVPIGFASLNGGTTGGGTGPTVTATTPQEFINYVSQSGPLNINVDGMLSVGYVEVESDKTIFGIGATSGLVGGLQLDNVSNVIIRNLSISNPAGNGSGDTIEVTESTNVWIDHNNIFNSTDGLLDIVRESDFVTVSWNKFYYTPDFAQNVNTSHRFAMLIGNGDSATEDADNLHVTLHHNHWGDFVRERMPRVRFGDIHAFNEYYNAPGANYAIRSALEAQVLAENSVFENVDDPLEKQQTGLIGGSGNLFINTSGDMAADDDVFTPPYAYTLDDAVDVKNLVLAGAGVGTAFAGDFNDDGIVDAADYTVWRDNLGAAAYLLPNDVDGGTIGTAQYNTWKSNFGNTQTAAFSTSSVPEPTAVTIALLAGCIVSSRTWRENSHIDPQV